MRHASEAQRRSAVSYHREVLLAAMTAESASLGFADTTVARVAARAGVSRAEFYRQFADKEECFLATFDEVTQRAWSRVALASGLLAPAMTDPPARARAGVTILLDVASLQPEAALFVTQARGAGTQARERLDGTLELFEQALVYQGAKAAREQGVSGTVVAGIVGGIYRVIYERLCSRREQELPRLVGEIVEWIMLYDNSTRRSRPQGGNPERGEQGAGRGANTRTVSAAEAPSPYTRPATGGSSRRERLAAYDAGIERVMGAAEQSLRDAPDWPAGVRGALGTLAELLGKDQRLLELLTVEIFALGEAGRERDAQSLAAFATLLTPSANLPRGASALPLVSELIAGGVWEILYRHAVRGRGPELPERTSALSYLALTPFVDR